MHNNKQVISSVLKKYVKKGEYIISVLADEDTVWTFTALVLPIFDFKITKIFQADESGKIEIHCLKQEGNLYFDVRGIKIKKIFDLNFPYI